MEGLKQIIHVGAFRFDGFRTTLFKRNRDTICASVYLEPPAKLTRSTKDSSKFTMAAAVNAEGTSADKLSSILRRIVTQSHWEVSTGF